MFTGMKHCQVRPVGVPDKGSEDYRYADIGAFSTRLEKSFGEQKINFKVKEIFHCDVPDLDTNLLLLVNGRYYNNGHSC
jgi:Fe-S cluster assembly protein SufD